MNEQTLGYALLETPVTYAPRYARITGSLLPGILLTHLLYLSENSEEVWSQDDFFYRELGISSEELKIAQNKLMSSGLVFIEEKSSPAGTYYRIDIELMANLIVDHPAYKGAFQDE